MLRSAKVVNNVVIAYVALLLPRTSSSMITRAAAVGVLLVGARGTVRVRDVVTYRIAWLAILQETYELRARGGSTAETRTLAHVGV